jgi:hypothetical protein
MIPEPFWLDTEAVITFHGENLQRFGGPEGIPTFRALAAGDITKDQLATWIRDHMVPR